METPKIWDDRIRAALQKACENAELYRGATSPNPPVGSAALDAEGRILSVHAHEKAGTAHAEARVIEDLRQRGALDRAHTVVVTLEPCNHQGRTPPCSEALLGLPALKRVFFAVSDPNPKAEGGEARLRQAGIETYNLGERDPNDPLVERARDLTRPFFHWIRTGRPWVTLKTAWRSDESGRLSMIPPAGKKTFTSMESLRLAHQLRKRSDAIITGSGTILADCPELTIRHVPDHPGKSRWLGILDRRGRVPQEWIDRKTAQGFKPRRSGDLSQLLAFLGEQGVLEVLVEAGPTLSGCILESGLWNEQFRIVANPGAGDRPDEIVRKLNSHRISCSQES